MMTTIFGWLSNNPQPMPQQDNTFSFPELPFTEEERKLEEIYSKFQTSTYVAYVPKNLYPYLRLHPEYLESKEDSVAMREARQWLWGKPASQGNYQYELENRNQYEQYLVMKEKQKLQDQWMRDHETDRELREKYFAIHEKYSFQNYILQSIPEGTTIKRIITYVCNNSPTAQFYKVAIISSLFVSVVSILYYCTNSNNIWNNYTRINLQP